MAFNVLHFVINKFIYDLINDLQTSKAQCICNHNNVNATCFELMDHAEAMHVQIDVTGSLQNALKSGEAIKASLDQGITEMDNMLMAGKHKIATEDIKLYLRKLAPIYKEADMNLNNNFKIIISNINCVEAI